MDINPTNRSKIMEIIGSIGLGLAIFGAKYPAKNCKINALLIGIGVSGMLIFAFAP